MATKPELELAFDTVTDAQKATILATDEAVESFVVAISAIMENYPAPSNDPVRQILSRFVMTAGGFQNFEINNLKTTYGMNIPPA